MGRVRLKREEPQGTEGRRYSVPSIPGVVFVGRIDQDEPEIDGQYRRLPHIGVWCLVDEEHGLNYFGTPRRGIWMIHAEYNHTDLRDWLDEHFDEVYALMEERRAKAAADKTKSEVDQ